jgi:DNA-binding LacI/PurR family transcriptional regulator
VAQAKESRFEDNRARLAGYLDTLAEAGIEPGTVPIWETSGLSIEDAMPGALGLLGTDPRPTALLCMSDQLALAALAVAKRLRIDVPERLSVVGFDDAPPARWAEPALTTVRQDLVRKGRTAGELALRLLAGRRPPRPVTLDVELVVRASTARVPRK